MPWSDRLGMFIHTPDEGVQEGQWAGNLYSHAADQAQQSIRENRRLDMDAAKLKMIEADTAQKASAIQLRQMGLAEMKEEIDKGTPFEKAFFNASPKLFSDKPEVIGKIIQTEAAQKAKETYQATVNDRANKALLERTRHDREMELKSNQSPELRRATEEANLLLKTRPQQPTELDPGMEGPAPEVDPMERDKMILGNLQKQNAFKDAQEKRRADAEKRKESTLDAATKMEISNIGKRIATLQKAHDAIESEVGAVKDHPNQLKRMKLNAEIAGLKEQARILSGATKASPAAPSTEPAKQGEALKLGSKLKQGGKTYIYQGGDVNDPASYVEEK